MPIPYRSRRSPGAFLLFVLFVAASICKAADTKEPVEFGPVADAFRKHCVQVYVHAAAFEGKPPAVGGFADDIANERPTLIGGYWWDERHVIVEDPVLQDQFIHSLEIAPPSSGMRYPARVAGRMIAVPAMILEVLPDEDGALPQAFPLRFADGDVKKSMVLSYGWDHGAWRVAGDGWGGTRTLADDGVRAMAPGARGVLFSRDGVALGLAFGERLFEAPRAEWSGASVRDAAIAARVGGDGNGALAREQMADAVLQTRFHLRVHIEDDDDDDAWSIGLNGTGVDLTEVKAAGLVVGARHLFIPVPLQAEAIARIESIGVVRANGNTIKARFVGACREYEAIVIETDEDLPAANIPPGFAMLNPLVVPEEAFSPEGTFTRPEGELFYRRHIDYKLGRRNELSDYDRWLGTFRGFRGDTVVLTGTNEQDGDMAFDKNGALAALSLTPRVLDANDNRPQAAAGFRPVDFLYGKLRDGNVFDPTLAPVAEDEGRRLVDFGVEYQALDANTARLFNVAAETRGGAVGMLVNHVYPGSTADKAGIHEQDVLLRLFIEGRREPVELIADDASSRTSQEFAEMSADSIQQMLSFMPPPWPSRENALSLILTGAGVGKRAALEYVREGEPERVEFLTEYTASDYRNAPKTRFEELGLTVKPVTYEVERYFLRPDSSGVIVSRVEEGSKASVAGMYPYQLVTRVDGEPIQGPEDFALRARSFEAGDSGSIELTVESFGKTRLVRIEHR